MGISAQSVCYVQKRQSNYLFSSMNLLIVEAKENMLRLACTFCPAALITIL